MHRQATRTIHRSSKALASGPKSLPQKYFVSPEIFEQEQAQFFSKEWLLVGHQSQIAHAGDYLVQRVSGESLIVTRDKGGRIHGFFNVCRHRGSRLIEDDGGNRPAIQCPYHTWTYGLDGRLIGAPHMDEVPGFDKADYSLHRVNLGLWEGFIFVNLVPKRDGYYSKGNASTERGGYRSLEDWFAPLNQKFSHWNMSILRPVKRIEYDVNANWKLMLEN